MKLSDLGVEFIAHEEGEVLRVYLDQVGIPTAGIGHVVRNTQYHVGDRITQQQSRDWFKADVAKCEEAIGSAVKLPLKQNQFDALVSFTFNVGVAGFLTSTLLRMLNQGDFSGAAAQFKRWNKAFNGTKMIVLPVLDGRRQRECSLFTDGKYK
jgi:lysozyme